MKIEVTTIFDDWFKNQVDMAGIAAWFKSKKLDSFEKVLLFITVRIHQSELLDGSEPITGEMLLKNRILWEYELAFAYNICKINNTLS